MTLEEFICSLPGEMFADSDPDYCPDHGWDCPERDTWRHGDISWE